jgi:hypothetical protein
MVGEREKLRLEGQAKSANSPVFVGAYLADLKPFKRSSYPRSAVRGRSSSFLLRFSLTLPTAIRPMSSVLPQTMALPSKEESTPKKRLQLLDLPEDVLREIILLVAPFERSRHLYYKYKHLKHVSDLCLVCRALLPYARECLYCSLPVLQCYSDKGTYPSRMPRDKIPLLWRTLSESRDTWQAGSFVRTAGLAWIDTSEETEEGRWIELLVTVFEHCPNIRAFYIHVEDGQLPDLVDIIRSFPHLESLAFAVIKDGAVDRAVDSREQELMPSMLGSIAGSIKRLHLHGRVPNTRIPAPYFPRLQNLTAFCHIGSELPDLAVQISGRASEHLTSLTMCGHYGAEYLIAILNNTGASLQELTLSSMAPDFDFSTLDLSLCGQLRLFSTDAAWFSTKHWHSFPPTLEVCRLGQSIALLSPLQMAIDLERPAFLPRLKFLKAGWKPPHGVQKRPLRESRDRALKACQKRGIEVELEISFFRAWDDSESESSEGSSWPF